MYVYLGKTILTTWFSQAVDDRKFFLALSSVFASKVCKKCQYDQKLIFFNNMGIKHAEFDADLNPLKMYQ
jgi:hypothetical protein